MFWPLDTGECGVHKSAVAKLQELPALQKWVSVRHIQGSYKHSALQCERHRNIERNLSKASSKFESQVRSRVAAFGV